MCPSRTIHPPTRVPKFLNILVLIPVQTETTDDDDGGSSFILRLAEAGCSEFDRCTGGDDSSGYVFSSKSLLRRREEPNMPPRTLPQPALQDVRDNAPEIQRDEISA